MPLLGFVSTRRGFLDDSYLKDGLHIRYVDGRCVVKACNGYTVLSYTIGIQVIQPTHTNETALWICSPKQRLGVYFGLKIVWRSQLF